MIKYSKLSIYLLFVASGLAFFNSYSNPAANSGMIAAKILQYSQKPEGTVLTDTEASDLNIIKGKRAGDITFFSKVNRTKTQFGAETLKHLLVNPLNDRTTILNRQNFIRTLKNDAELLRKIDSNIDKIKSNEDNLFKFWSDTHKLGPDFLELSTKLVGADNSKVLTELTRAGAFTGIGALGAVGAGGSLFLGAQFITFLYNRLTGAQIASSYHNQIYAYDAEYDIRNGIFLALALGLAGLSYYRLIPAFKNQSKISSEMLELLSSINAILGASKELNALIGKMDEAKKALVSLKNLEIYTESFEGLSSELTSLIKQLQKNTFVNNTSWVTFVGRIRVAYKKFNELKDGFKDLFKAIGEVDAYASFARLMNEYSDKDTKFCFVDYTPNNKVPVAEFENGWCTTIAQDKIVTQSLNLGNKVNPDIEGSYYPNVYLTAANGAGKSTLLILAAHNTILSQVAGMAAAASWKAGIFDSIITHVNIDHNTESGQSAYAVEQERMNNLRDDIKRKFNNGRVVLAVIDEPYKSTKETLASASLEEFTTEIEFYDKCICLIASHFLNPAKKIEERKNGRFVNLCIPTRETQPKSGVFIRDHKIVPGIDEWLQEDPQDLSKTDRYDKWLAFTKLDKNA